MKIQDGLIGKVLINRAQIAPRISQLFAHLKEYIKRSSKDQSEIGNQNCKVDYERGCSRNVELNAMQKKTALLFDNPIRNFATSLVLHNLSNVGFKPHLLIIMQIYTELVYASMLQIIN